ncbi:extensin [Iris pallida]|uniref:Extensin n=1 Tax=Iris pallida TaxID=29817 RepID=A0AAX6HN35_IRIPA|nr:extensin [Iris pallida]
MLAIPRAVPLALSLFCERHLELVADAAPFPGHRPPSRPNTPPPPGSGSHSRGHRCPAEDDGPPLVGGVFLLMAAV